MSDQAKSRLILENARARVTEWKFDKRGDTTGWHRHEHDYLIVPLFDGQLEEILPDGKSQMARIAYGAPYFREAGVEHEIRNANDFGCGFIEIEFV